MIHNLTLIQSLRTMVVRTQLRLLSLSERVTRTQEREGTRSITLLQVDSWLQVGISIKLANLLSTINLVWLMLATHQTMTHLLHQAPLCMTQALLLLMAHSKQSRPMACITIQDLLGTDPQLTWQMKENLRM